MITNSKPHILFISSWWPTDKTSAGTFVELHALALESRGCDCAILLSGEATLKNSRKGKSVESFQSYRRNSKLRFINNFTIHKVPLRFSSNPLEKRKQNILKSSVKAIEDYIKKWGKPDFIFHHGVFDYCYLTEFVSSQFDLPIYYMENSPNLDETSFPCANPFDNESSQRDFVRKTQKRFAVTKAYVQKMSNLFEVDFQLCPNVITDDFFISPDEIKKDREVFRFINVAILDERKNQKMIIRAFASQFKDKPGYTLTVAGDGPLKKELEDLALELGVEEQVSIPGFCDRAEILRLLDQSHCFVLGSHSETFGVVLIEAMARGIPCISTAIDGPLEIVNDTNGLLCDSNSAEAMAESMVQMVERYSEYNPADIIKSVKSRYGPDAVKNAICTHVSA